MHTRSSPDRDNLFAVIAIAILSVCTSDVVHEAIGHGSACLVSGLRITLLSSAFFHCSGFGAFIAAAGPLANIAAGVVAFAVQGIISPNRPALRLYALLVMAFSLFWEAGYLIQAMIKDQGDAVFAYRELIGHENTVVRAGAVVIGVLAYFLFGHMLRIRAAVFANAPERVGRLMRISWGTALACMALVGLLYAPDRSGACQDATLSVLASFPLWFVGRSTKPMSGAAAPILGSRWLIAAGLAALVMFALTMGRGLSS